MVGAAWFYGLTAAIRCYRYLWGDVGSLSLGGALGTIGDTKMNLSWSLLVGFSRLKLTFGCPGDFVPLLGR